MTLQEELVFRVPDIALRPRFSLDRHKPQSRLQNFHSLDYDEEMFIDISYCDKSFNKVFKSNNHGILNSASLGITLTDFSSLIANRKGSTSTPFRTASAKADTFKQSDSSKVCHFDSAGFRPRLISLTEDSGFIESSVANTFAQSCNITSPVSTRRNKRPRDEGVNCYPLNCNPLTCVIDDEYSSEPLPCLSLEKRFDDLKSDSENSNDSTDTSFVGKLELENIKPFEGIHDLIENSTASVASLHKGLSTASSGYGSLSSQISNFDNESLSQSSASHHFELSNKDLEQVVPVITHTDTCDDKSSNATLESIAETAEEKISTGEPCLKELTFSQRIAKVLNKVSPKDPERLIGRKIGLEKVDIIGELQSRNIFPALSVLFGYLSDADLQTLCSVSDAWKISVYGDVKANSRRLQKFSEAQHVLDTEKENRAFDKEEGRVGVQVLTGARAGRPLNTLQPAATPVRTEPLSPIKAATKYQQFVQAASNLKVGESLRKCPKCSGPSRVDSEQERAYCLNDRCTYDFCIKCRDKFHGSSDCTASVSKKSRSDRQNKIGSKKSRQALKRL